MRTFRTIFILAAALIGGSPALADPNPNTVPTRAKIFVACGDKPEQSSEVEPSLNCGAKNSFASAVKSGNNGAFASAFASSPGGSSGEDYSAVGAITYSFVVWGGNIGDPVPLKIKTVLTQDSSEPHLGVKALAQINVFNPQGNQLAIKQICSLGCGAGGDANEYAGTLTIASRAGSQYVVNILADVMVADRDTSTFASATADPYIFVDPTFADAAKYSVAVSEGIANFDPSLAPGAVPEPASWALMLAGCGLVGGALRRRSRVPASFPVMCHAART